MSTPTAVTTLLKGTIVSLDDEIGDIENGAVAVDGDTIVAVGTISDIMTRYVAATVVDVPDAVIMPGMIDGHTHTAQSLVRGLIANELPMIFRLYVPAMQALDARGAGLSAKLAAAQLLRSGVTTICEGAVGYSPEAEAAVIAAFEEAGIRVMLSRGSGDQDFHHAALYSQITERSWFKKREGEALMDLARTRALLERHPTDGSSLINIAICSSSLLDFSSEYFAVAADLAEEFDAKLHVHLSRDREEVEFCLAAFGRRPIEHLDHLGYVNERLVAAHCMLASEPEIEMLRRGGASLAHSPIECLNILNAVPAIQRFRAAGIKVALGCDNAVNDMWETMRAVWLMQATARGLPAYDPSHVTETDILTMATREAANALGMGRHIGRIVPGLKADLVVLDGSGAHMFPRQSLLAELVRYGTRAEVNTVMIGGRIVVENAVHTTIDLAKLRADTVGFADRIRELVEPRRYQATSTRWRIAGCCGWR